MAFARFTRSSRHMRFGASVLVVASSLAAGCGRDEAGHDDAERTATIQPVQSAAAPAGGRGGALRVVYTGGPRDGAAGVVRSSGLAEDVVAAINGSIALPATVTIILGGDPAGPYYDPERATIQYPWGFVDTTMELLRGRNYRSGTELDDAVIDATRFVLQHEIAHALIDQLDVPVLGDEEDAADAFATFLAVEYGDDGDQVIAARDMFGAVGTERRGRTGGSAYVDAHALDARRFYTMSCRIYGADTTRYRRAIEGLEVAGGQLDGCPAEYDQIRATWATALERHLKSPSNDS